ncbi:MAG: sigma-70 family RNA polymerase sigma factor [Planctomycetia bacterium]|nr:sigma-70 family RNA polymerase sigma factor [Planctomycetia bacterium]
MNSNESEQLATKIFMANMDYVHRIACINAPSPDVIDDIVNEAFLLFMEGRDKWQLNSPGIKGLLGVLTRQCAFRLRHTNRGLTQELARKIYEAIADRKSPIAGEGLYDEEKICLPEAIQKLPLRYQEILRLYYYEKQSVREIARELGMKEENVCRALSRMRIRLRSLIEELRD